jgi:hypothetical protein
MEIMILLSNRFDWLSCKNKETEAAIPQYEATSEATSVTSGPKDQACQVTTPPFESRQEICNKERARLLDAGFIKCIIRIGLPIPFLYPKRIKIEGYVLIILILIRHEKRSIQITPDRSSCGLHIRLQPSKFSRLLLWVSSNSPQSRRPNQDVLHYFI